MNGPGDWLALGLMMLVSIASHFIGYLAGYACGRGDRDAEWRSWFRGVGPPGGPR